MFLCLVVISTLWLNGVNSIACNTPESSCKCETDEGTVDLTSLDSGSSSTAGLHADATSSAYSYEYNPCTPFSMSSPGGGGTGCDNVAACQVDDNFDPPSYWPLADTSTYKWGSDGTNLQITMTKTDNQGTTRTMIITLICDQGTDAIFQMNDDTTLTYTFTLTSKCCCPGACGGGGGGGGGGSVVSVGTIILIVALIFVIIYFVGGILFMHFAKGARGSEMIPNVTFWKAVPGLVKDGTLFVASGVKGHKGYDQI